MSDGFRFVGVQEENFDNNNINNNNDNRGGFNAFRGRAVRFD